MSETYFCDNPNFAASARMALESEASDWLQCWRALSAGGSRVVRELQPSKIPESLLWQVKALANDALEGREHSELFKFLG